MFLAKSFPRLLNSSGFLLVITCFFFNFITISCNHEPVATIRGWTLVKGGKPEAVIPQWAEGLSNEDIREFGQNGNAALTQSRRIPMQPAATAIVLLCALGVMVSWAPSKIALYGTTVAAGLSILALGMLHYFLADFDRISHTATADLNPLSKEDLQFIRLFSIDWNWPYWLALSILILIFGHTVYQLLRKRF